MSPFAVGAIALILVAILIFWGFTKANPFASPFKLHATFESSNNIKSGSPVRIAGVNVGRVTGVEPTAPGGGGAIVTFELQDTARPIHKDARARIRPRIFLEGNFFVDLEPGSPSAPVLDDGDVIPLAQTATPVQFDQVLSALTKDTRSDLQNLFQELSDAYESGAAEAFNRSLRYQPAAHRYTAVVMDALLGQRPHDLSDFVRDFGTVAEALDRDPRALQSLVTDLNTTLAALAREEGALQAAIAELPRTLEVAGPAFDALNAAFPPTRRLAREALPGVRSSRPAIEALLPLVGELRGLVSERELRGLSRDLRAATPGLATLAATSPGLLRQLRALSACNNRVVLPWSRQEVGDPVFEPRGPVFQEQPKAFPALGGESRSFDANTQWFKVLGTGGVETLRLGNDLFGTTLLPVLGTNPPPSRSRPPIRPDVPCETQQRPDLRSEPAEPPTRVDANSSSPAARARADKARTVALHWLRGVLAEQGDRRQVADRDATRADIEAAARENGLLDQLRTMRERLAR